KANRRAGGIDRQLLRQVASELLFVGQQEVLQFANIAELPTVGELAAGVHRQRVMEGESLSALGDALRRLATGLRPIAVPPAAHDVEILEGEARRIHLRVTGVA